MRYNSYDSLPAFLFVGLSVCAAGAHAESQHADYEVIETRAARYAPQEFSSDNTLVIPESVAVQQRSISDVLAQITGVDYNGQGGLFQSYNIRGFSRWRIRTEVDGIPIITDRRAGNALSFLPPELISNVYLQKGPAAALYGSGAMGGVLTATTIAEHSQIGLHFQPVDNSHSIYGQYANENWHIGALHREADDAEASDGTPLNTHYEQSVVKGGFSAQWRNIDVTGSSMLSRGRDIGKSAATFPQQRNTNYPEDNHWLNQIKLSRGTDWSLRFSHHNQDWQTDIARLEENRVTRRNLTDYDADTLGVLGWRRWGSFTVGGEWLGRRNVKITESELAPQGRLLWQTTSVDANEDNVSVFLQHTASYDAFDLNIGLRVDQVEVRQRGNTRDDEALSFSVGATYQLSQDTRIHGEVASAFRFPSVSELFFAGQTPRGATLGNPDLVAEESVNYQLSLSHQLTYGLALELSAFHYDVDNYIERYEVNDELRSFRNTQSANISGHEVSLRWDANPLLYSSLSYQYHKGESVTGITLDDIQAPAIKWLVNWQPEMVLGGRLSISNTMTYRFSKDNFGPSEKPFEAQFLWHLSAGYQVSDNSTLGIVISNLTDADYVSSADDQAPLQPQRTVSINWKQFF